MGLLDRLFGFQGKVAFTCTDSNGDKIKGKVHIETLFMTPTEIEHELTKQFYYNHGLRVSNMQITGKV